MTKLILNLIVIFSSNSFAAIYGKDDLVPMFRAPVAAQTWGKSVGMMVGRNFLTPQGDKTKLQLWSLTENAYLCKENPWAKYESIPVSCTGFLISPDLMITAGHCMVNMGEANNEVTPQCRDFVWVFQLDFNYNFKLPQLLQQNQIAECGRVIKAVHNSVTDPRTGKIDFKDDYALIRLKNPVNFPFLKLTDLKLQEREAISFIGHPLGTGTMYGIGKVLSVETAYYRTNLDAIEGHSGSPVLNKNGEVQGVLVRGYPETLIEGQDQSCNLINHCDEEAKQCQQNDVMEKKMGEHVHILTKTFIQSLLQGQ